jgi:hypothetical protein
MCCPKPEFSTVESVKLLLELLPCACLSHAVNICKLGDNIRWLLPGYAMFYNIVSYVCSAKVVCLCRAHITYNMFTF